MRNAWGGFGESQWCRDANGGWGAVCPGNVTKMTTTIETTDGKAGTLRVLLLALVLGGALVLSPVAQANHPTAGATCSHTHASADARGTDARSASSGMTAGVTSAGTSGSEAWSDTTGVGRSWASATARSGSTVVKAECTGGLGGGGGGGCLAVAVPETLLYTGTYQIDPADALWFVGALQAGEEIRPITAPVPAGGLIFGPDLPTEEPPADLVPIGTAVEAILESSALAIACRLTLSAV